MLAQAFGGCRPIYLGGEHGRVVPTVSAYGTRTQLRPDRLKTHALLGSVQKPSQVGASACPQGVVRHSQEPLSAAAEHTRPRRTVPGTAHGPTSNTADSILTRLAR
jgi:hypothetical protein